VVSIYHVTALNFKTFKLKLQGPQQIGSNWIYGLRKT